MRIKGIPMITFKWAGVGPDNPDSVQKLKVYRRSSFLIIPLKLSRSESFIMEASMFRRVGTAINPQKTRKPWLNLKNPIPTYPWNLGQGFLVIPEQGIREYVDTTTCWTQNRSSGGRHFGMGRRRCCCCKLFKENGNKIFTFLVYLLISGRILLTVLALCRYQKKMPFWREWHTWIIW